MNRTNNHDEINLDHLLEDLRREHRSIQPPAALVETLIAHHSSDASGNTRRTAGSRLWFLTLATSTVIAIAVLLLRPHSAAAPSVLQTQTAPLQSRPAQIPPALNTRAQPTPRPLVKRPTTRRIMSSHDSFVQLPTSTGLPEPTQAVLIRTRIDTSSLRSYGLTPPPPGAPQTILAEFLIGDDGLPRAIRLVR
ncbi:MAG: hypothetical protein JSS95_07295 [Acidobacteria bacterium]|nr:hypothetical protein [Acidobacteriota bacterium]